MPITATTYTLQSAGIKYAWVLNKITSANFPADCSVSVELLDGNREIRLHLMRAGKRLTTLVVEHVPKALDAQKNEVDIEQRETINNSQNQTVLDNWIAEIKGHYKL